LPALIDRADGDSAAVKIIHPAGVHEVPVFDDQAGAVDGVAVEVGYRASDHQSAAGLVSQLPSQVLSGAEVEYLYGSPVVQQADEHVDSARVEDLGAGQICKNTLAVLTEGSAINQCPALLVDDAAAPDGWVEKPGVGEGSRC